MKSKSNRTNQDIKDAARFRDEIAGILKPSRKHPLVLGSLVPGVWMNSQILREERVLQAKGEKPPSRHKRVGSRIISPELDYPRDHEGRALRVLH